MGKIWRVSIILSFILITFNGTFSCGSEESPVGQTTVPLNINGKQVIVHAVSLVINEPGEFQESNLIRQTTIKLLAGVGVQALESGSGEATLKIDQNGSYSDVPYEEENTGRQVTLRGVETEIAATLSSPPHGTITGQASFRKTPPYRVTVPSGEARVEPREVVIPALIRALTDIWGDHLSVNALKDTDASIRQCAVEALTRFYTLNETISQSPMSATGLLDVWIHDNESDVRYGAYSALKALGSRAGEIVPNLVELLVTEEDPNLIGFNSIQTQVGELLINIGSPSLPALTGLLEHESPDIRSYAIGALDKVGTSSTDIMALLRDENVSVVERAARSLMNTNPEAVLPSLTEVLTDKNESARVRGSAAFAMVMLWKDKIWRDKQDQIMPALLDIINNDQEDDLVRKQMLATLIYFGPEEHGKTLPVFIEFLQPERKNFHYSVATDLRIIGPPAMQAVPEIIDAMRNDSFKEGKSIFAEALKAITGENFGDNADKWQQWWEHR